MHLKLSDLGTFERPSNPVSPRVATQLGGGGGQGGFGESAELFFWKRTGKGFQVWRLFFSLCIQLTLVTLLLFFELVTSCFVTCFCVDERTHKSQ